LALRRVADFEFDETEEVKNRKAVAAKPAAKE